MTTDTKAKARYHIDIDGSDIVRRLGDTETRFTLIGINQETIGLLAIEGFIGMVSRGAVAADLLAGKGFPNRAPPVVRTAKERGPTQLVQAIARVRTADRMRAAKAAGEKVDPGRKADIESAALVWAKSLTDAQQKSLSTTEGVAVELARIKAKKMTLDEALAATDAGPAEQVKDDLADAAPVAQQLAAD